VITSSLIAAVKAHKTAHAKVSPHVHVLNTHESQSKPNGTCHVRVPSTVLSGTTTIK